MKREQNQGALCRNVAHTLGELLEVLEDDSGLWEAIGACQLGIVRARCAEFLGDKEAARIALASVYDQEARAILACTERSPRLVRRLWGRIRAARYAYRTLACLRVEELNFSRLTLDQLQSVLTILVDRHCYKEVRALCGQALEGAGDGIEVGRIVVLLLASGDVSYQLGEHEQALEAYTRALALCGTTADPALKLQTHATLAEYWWRAAKMAEAKRHLGEAYRIARRHDFSVARLDRLQAHLASEIRL